MVTAYATAPESVWEFSQKIVGNRYETVFRRFEDHAFASGDAGFHGEKELEPVFVGKPPDAFDDPVPDAFATVVWTNEYSADFRPPVGKRKEEPRSDDIVHVVLYGDDEAVGRDGGFVEFRRTSEHRGFGYGDFREAVREPFAVAFVDLGRSEYSHFCGWLGVRPEIGIGEEGEQVCAYRGGGFYGSRTRRLDDVGVVFVRSSEAGSDKYFVRRAVQEPEFAFFRNVLHRDRHLGRFAGPVEFRDVAWNVSVGKLVGNALSDCRILFADGFEEGFGGKPSVFFSIHYAFESDVGFFDADACGAEEDDEFATDVFSRKVVERVRFGVSFFPSLADDLGERFFAFFELGTDVRERSGKRSHDRDHFFGESVGFLEVRNRRRSGHDGSVVAVAVRIRGHSDVAVERTHERLLVGGDDLVHGIANDLLVEFDHFRPFRGHVHEYDFPFETGIFHGLEDFVMGRIFGSEDRGVFEPLGVERELFGIRHSHDPRRIEVSFVAEVEFAYLLDELASYLASGAEDEKILESHVFENEGGVNYFVGFSKTPTYRGSSFSSRNTIIPHTAFLVSSETESVGDFPRISRSSNFSTSWPKEQ